MTIEIVSFPMMNMVIFHGYVSLPEGNGEFVGSSQCRPSFNAPFLDIVHLRQELLTLAG